mmetsp:Transcript_23873/g.66853  ORF Transcript_23873/g.66853 Transcript_23873/m.66853 type:complete len:384 (-) Transcript_23873:12-1163(-)
MSLGKFGPVRGQDERHVAELWDWQVQSLVDKDLPRSVHQVLLRAEHVCDAHLRVIHYNAEVVHGHTGIANNDEIATQVIGIPLDLTQHQVVDHHLLVLGHAEAVHIGRALAEHLLDLGCRRPGPRAIHDESLLVFLSLCAHSIEILGSQEALVHLVPCNQLLELLLVDPSIHALALPIRTDGAAAVRALIPSDAAPLQAFQDRGLGVRGRPSHVRVLDSEDHLAALRLREEPVEECRAGAADVEHARRRRCEADTGSHRPRGLLAFNLGSIQDVKGTPRCRQQPGLVMLLSQSMTAQRCRQAPATLPQSCPSCRQGCGNHCRAQLGSTAGLLSWSRRSCHSPSWYKRCCGDRQLRRNEGKHGTAGRPQERTHAPTQMRKDTKK